MGPVGAYMSCDLREHCRTETGPGRVWHADDIYIYPHAGFTACGGDSQLVAGGTAYGEL